MRSGVKDVPAPPVKDVPAPHSGRTRDTRPPSRAGDPWHRVSTATGGGPSDRPRAGWPARGRDTGSHRSFTLAGAPGTGRCTMRFGRSPDGGEARLGCTCTVQVPRGAGRGPFLPGGGPETECTVQVPGPAHRERVTLTLPRP